MSSDYKISVTDKNNNKEEFSVNIENGNKTVQKYQAKECGAWWIFYLFFVVYPIVFAILFFNYNSKENEIFFLIVLGVLVLASIICFSVFCIKHFNEHIRIEKLNFLSTVLEEKKELDNIYDNESINEEHRKGRNCRDNKKTKKTKNLGIELCCKIVNAVGEV